MASGVHCRFTGQDLTPGYLPVKPYTHGGVPNGSSPLVLEALTFQFSGIAKVA